MFLPRQGNTFVVLIWWVNAGQRDRYMTPHAHIVFKQYPKRNFLFWDSTFSRVRIPDRTLARVTFSSFHILPSSSLLTILPSDDTLQATDAHIFQRWRQPSQNSTRQMADMKQVPYWGPQKISVATIQKIYSSGICTPHEPKCWRN
jgi:hypothetical protein